MPRASLKKSSAEDKSVFYMIVAVALVAMVAGANDLFLGSRSRAQSAVSADVYSSIDTSAPKSAELVPIMEDEPKVDFNPSDRLPQCDFRSSVKNIVYGQPVRFYWDCMQASSCLLDGVGSVPASKKDGIEVSPRRSAKYQLKCDNPEGSRSFDIDINVFEFTLREINSTAVSE